MPNDPLHERKVRLGGRGGAPTNSARLAPPPAFQPAAAQEPRYPRILEASQTLDLRWALTVQWADGEETLEIVSDRGAALLGYKPDDLP